MAIGFDELLLHGETRPFDVSSSQSNQRVFYGYIWLVCLSHLLRKLRWKGNRSLWPETSNLPEVLACNARTQIIRAQNQYNIARCSHVDE